MVATHANIRQYTNSQDLQESHTVSQDSHIDGSILTGKELGLERKPPHELSNNVTTILSGRADPTIALIAFTGQDTGLEADPAH